MPSFDKFMLRGFHAILIVFPHLLRYGLVTCWFTFSTKLAFTEGPLSGSAQRQPPSYTGHRMGWKKPEARALPSIKTCFDIFVFLYPVGESGAEEKSHWALLCSPITLKRIQSRSLT